MGRVFILRRAEESAAPRTSGVLPVALDDAALLARVRAKDPKAGDLLVEHCKDHIERVLYRVLGRTEDLDDLLHDTLIAVLEGVGGLREDVRFRGWLTQVTVFVARGAIRKRRRKWWLVFTDEVPERGTEVDDDTSEAMRATYRVLDRLDADERIAFALRKIDGMELTEVAAACNVSLATIKRWLTKAEARFFELAREEEALDAWLDAEVSS